MYMGVIVQFSHLQCGSKVQFNINSSVYFKPIKVSATRIFARSSKTIDNQLSHTKLYKKIKHSCILVLFLTPVNAKSIES